MYPITKQNIIIRSCSFTRCNVFTRFLFCFAAFSLSGQFPRAYTAPCCLFVTYVVYLFPCFVITLPFMLPCLLVSFAISRVQKGAKLSSTVPPTMIGMDIFYFLSVPVSQFLYRQAAVLFGNVLLLSWWCLFLPLLFYFLFTLTPRAARAQPC